MAPLLGLVAPFKGAQLVTTHRLWGRVAVQGALNLALATACVWAASRWWGIELGMNASAWWSRFALWAVSALSGIAVFVGVQPALNGALNAALSARVEAGLTGAKIRAPLRALGRSLVHGLVKTVLFACAALLLVGDRFLVGWLNGWAAGLMGVAGGLVVLTMLAYDGFDHVLARRGATFGGKWRYLGAHPALTLGYGIGVALLYLIPFALVVAPAFAAAGATFAYVQTEKRRDARKAATAPIPVAAAAAAQVTEERKP